VSIGPVIAGALPYLQAQAESMQTDICTITRVDPTAPKTFDDTTGTYATPDPLTVYTGKCRVSGHKTRFDKVENAGQEPVSSMRIYVDLPVSANYTPAVDDIVTVTSSLDPGAVGQKFRVRQPQFGSQMTARHLGCEWTELSNG
jgi:hypothetical protein